jgi:TonB family protein
MMEIALALLLAALGLVIFHDRDFWFPGAPESSEADDSLVEHASAGATPATAPATPATTASAKTSASKSKSPPFGKLRAGSLAKDARNGAPGFRANDSRTDGSRTGGSHANNRFRANAVTGATPSPSSTGDTAVAGPGFAVSAQRTVLPPLEVEVVAGDIHRTVHPGSSSVRVDLQAGSSAQKPAAPAAPSASGDSAATVTRNAAEQVQMSTDASAVVSSSVTPAYPLLARQMRVQGSVILQALISRDGTIQDLHVVSGPPILAAAAQEAVRQWHFKPHYQGADSVETLAKITVNFTISTN